MTRLHKAPTRFNQGLSLIIMASLALVASGCGKLGAESAGVASDEQSLDTLTTPYGWAVDYDPSFWQPEHNDGGDWVYTFRHEYEEDASDIEVQFATATTRTRASINELKCTVTSPCVDLDDGLIVQIFQDVFDDEYGPDSMAEVIQEDVEKHATPLRDSLRLAREASSTPQANEPVLDSVEGTYRSAAGWSASWDPNEWESWSNCPYGYANCDNFLGLQGGPVVYEYVNGPMWYGMILNISAAEEQYYSLDQSERIAACLDSTLQTLQENSGEIRLQEDNWILYWLPDPHALSVQDYRYKQCHVAGDTLVIISGGLTTKGYNAETWLQVDGVQIWSTDESPKPNP